MDLYKLMTELEDLIMVPVDLVPLNRAVPIVVLKALQEERMVFMKDRRIYSELLKRATAGIADIKLKLGLPIYFQKIWI